MQTTTSNRLLTGTILLVAAILFVLLNVTSGSLFKSLRLDLTSNKMYTLSAGSKEILAQLPEPIILRLYFSQKLAKTNPYLVSFAARAQDLLTQYVRASNGKIKLEVIDPEPFSPEEDNALNYGLQGVPVDNVGTDLYLGLVGTNSVGVKKVIPFIQPGRESNLEYDISQLIYTLAHPEQQTIGVINSLPMQTAQGKPLAIWQQLSESFAVKFLDLDLSAIPNDINTLMLVNPSSFSAGTLHAIDNFVMRGGHLIAFVDPYSEVAEQQPVTAEFTTLLQSWGVDFAHNKVVADRNLAKSVTVEQDGREVSLRYPLWIDCVAKNFDSQDILTSSLERVTLASPGSLTKLAGATTNFSPLFTTTNDAMLVDTKNIATYQENAEALVRNYEATGEYILAARVSGPIKSAFSDAATENSNIIIVADADMLHDHFWLSVQNVLGQNFVVPNSGNGNFVLGALDNLAGSDALISIRNRGAFTRPFAKIQALEVKSQEKYLAAEELLQQKLEATKQQLAQLDARQMDVADSFRKELVNTRRELREVRRKLNHDIELVEMGVKFFSIGFIPLVIVFGGLFVWGLQIQRELRSKKAVC